MAKQFQENIRCEHKEHGDVPEISMKCSHMSRPISRVLIIILAVGLGCTSYRAEMTLEEKVVARYEQNCGIEHICKHIFLDLISVGFAELWYHRVRTTYFDVMHQRQLAEEERRRWNEFVKSHLGLSKKDIIRKCGLPDREMSDGDGGIVMLYESSVRHGWMSAYAYGTRIGWDNVRSSGFSEWTDNAYVTQVWFMLDVKGLCNAIDRKKITRAAGGH